MLARSCTGTHVSRPQSTARPWPLYWQYGYSKKKDVIHSSVEGSFTLCDVEASMELVVKEVDSGFRRNGLHFWASDNHKAEECLWNKTVCKDHEPNLVESLDGSVEVSGVTDVEVSENKDDGQREDHSNENELFLVQDFFRYPKDDVTKGVAEDIFIKMGSEKDNNEFIEKDINSPQNDTSYGNKEIFVSQVASGDAYSGKSHERIGGYGGPRGFFRGGFSNRDGEGDRPRRPLDHRSRIGCDYESKRE
ncbi:hypothetical protein SASPL_118533 [Salvia splendens]|uniref:Uncharacterized protein n=1 Tax=Salvia splendens TaxID=180675 RepID=A0A8X8XXI1_SALSN|nr:hypothetical protein SASPL_118533 [Salvia splendens]